MKNMPLIIPVSQAKCQVKSWKNHLKESISDPKQLLAQLQLSPHQLDFELDLNNPFSMRVPQPFIDKMKIGDPKDPLFLQVISQATENLQVDGFDADPLQESEQQTPGLLHKYHGRVLLILASACAINCRYCFRRHFPYQEQMASGAQLTANLAYISDNSEITEVILSGGDPLMLNDKVFSQLINNLEKINHVKRLRIHTRLPVVIPQRLTPEFSQQLSESRLQVTLVLHINHPNEIDNLLAETLRELQQTNITLLNQSVLLKNINDNPAVLSQLSEKLFAVGVLPYYIHQLDKVAGAAHFEVKQKTAINLIQQLRDRLPGYLVPRLALEEPGKDSKTVIL